MHQINARNVELIKMGNTFYQIFSETELSFSEGPQTSYICRSG